MSSGTGSALTPSRAPNYDREPFVAVPAGAGACVGGWDAIGERVRTASRSSGERFVVVVDCYVGVHAESVREELTRRLKPALVIDSRGAFRGPEEIDRLVEPYLGGDDPIFGFLCGLTMDRFLDPAKLADLRRRVEQARGLVLIVGEAASAVHAGDLLVYADMPRWEGQLRQRRNEVSNLGVVNAELKASLQYKRSFFIDWRVCD
jgi:hypothetical protein